MTYRSKAKAYIAARKVLRKIRTSGWKIQLVENPEGAWHFKLLLRGMSLYEHFDYLSADHKYWTLFCHVKKWAGMGNPLFEVRETRRGRGDVRMFSNPNKAVKAQIKKVREFQSTLQEALEPFE